MDQIFYNLSRQNYQINVIFIYKIEQELNNYSKEKPKSNFKLENRGKKNKIQKCLWAVPEFLLFSPF